MTAIKGSALVIRKLGRNSKLDLKFPVSFRQFSFKGILMQNLILKRKRRSKQ